MRLRAGRLYALALPFKAAVGHSAAVRSCSDSIVVRLESESGAVGFGEAVARPYVTGETVPACMDYIARALWPAIRGKAHAAAGLPEPPAAIGAGISGPPHDAVIAWNAAWSAVEVALIDVALREAGRALGDLLPPMRSEVRYGGVIPAVPAGAAECLAARYCEAGITDIKIKVGDAASRDRVAAVRAAVGDAISLRADANGAWDTAQAIRELRALEPCALAVVEQPVARGDPRELARLRQAVGIPVMADESLVTVEDARDLIAARACDFFNLRIAKCGGIARVLAIAGMAREAGIRLQLGCQVGETAILSAVGRHVAAHLPGLEHVEGSFGTRLLAEDVAEEGVEFGAGGRAGLLRGPGLGIEVREEVLARYAVSTLQLGESSWDR